MLCLNPWSQVRIWKFSFFDKKFLKLKLAFLEGCAIQLGGGGGRIWECQCIIRPQLFTISRFCTIVRTISPSIIQWFTYAWNSTHTHNDRQINVYTKHTVFMRHHHTGVTDNDNWHNTCSKATEWSSTRCNTRLLLQTKLYVCECVSRSRIVLCSVLLCYQRIEHLLMHMYKHIDILLYGNSPCIWLLFVFLRREQAAEAHGQSVFLLVHRILFLFFLRF